MTFIWPMMLFSLFLLPVLLLLYLQMRRQRRQIAARYPSLGLLQTVSQTSRFRRYFPPTLFLIGLGLLLMALARPQAALRLPRVESTVILAFDVSGSMAAEDFEPTRMEAAKNAARDFVLQQPEDVLVGVVAFSDSGFAIQVPTDDQDAILAAINRLHPERGTSLGNGMLTALNTLIFSDEEPAPLRLSDLTPVPTQTPTPVPPGVYAPAVIVLLTDGENNESPDPLEIAQQAADRGIRIHTIGIGSPEGITLQIDGFNIHTQLNEMMLQYISDLTDGTYYNAQNEEDLQTIYENITPEFVLKREKMEVTAVFAGASLLLLLLSGGLSMLWFSRLI